MTNAVPDAAGRHTPEVDAMLASYPDPTRGAAHALRSLLLGADARIEEGVKWKSPSYHLGGVHFATFLARPGRPLQLVLHRDAKRRASGGRLPVPDAAGLLHWRDHDRANLSFADEPAVADAGESLTDTIRAWTTHL